MANVFCEGSNEKQVQFFSFRNLAVTAPPRGGHMAGRRQPGRVPGERHARRQAVGVSVPGPG